MGQQIVSAGADGTVRIWDVASGAAVRSLDGPHGVCPVRGVQPDGRRSSAPVRRHGAHLGCGERHSRAQPRGSYGSGQLCGVQPDGQQIVSAGDDGTVRIWDAASGTAVRSLEGHTRSGSWSAAYSPDGKQIVSAGADGTVRIWDVASGAAVRSLEGHAGYVSVCGVQPGWAADRQYR